MLIGMLLVVGGASALVSAALTSVISMIYFGAVMVVAGIMELIASFRLRDKGPVLAYSLAGILTAVVGGLLIANPLAALSSVTMLIAGYLFASSMFRGTITLLERYRGWGWDLAYAIATLALGVYVVAAWPLDSLYIVGTLVALEIISRGIALMAASWVLRDIEHGNAVEA